MKIIFRKIPAIQFWVLILNEYGEVKKKLEPHLGSVDPNLKLSNCPELDDLVRLIYCYLL